MALEAPPPELVDQLLPVYRLLVARVANIGLPTSWWRSASHNAEVGGAPHSQHLLGLAFDVGGPGSPDDIASRASSWWPGPVVIERDHVHLQLLPAGVIPARYFEWIARLYP